MAKTSMFGGGQHNLVNSAELPSSPAGTRLQYSAKLGPHQQQQPGRNNENADPTAGLSCYSVKGSSAVYRSPSPSNKGTTDGGETLNNAAAAGMSFLERMAKQGVSLANHQNVAGCQTTQ